MPTEYKRRAGEVHGTWQLIEPLGAGGNAEVWKAAGSDGREVAVKVLKSRNPESEPFKRFRDEVEILRSLDDRPGILPLLDFHLPEQPTRQNPAWLALALATPVRQALGDSPPLDMVVRAIADVAVTMAELAAEGTSHRDIKPDNLYEYRCQWALSDFGLVSFPGKEALTEEGRKLGPLHFLAPEMLSDPQNSAGPPADVYSLAKTLWVLATGQNYPPPGQQRVDVPQLTLSAYVRHGRAPLLDRLIENATAHNPADRPTMSEVSVELRAWLTPMPASSSTDLSDLAGRISATAEPRRRSEVVRLKQSREFEALLNSIMHRLQPLSERLGRAIGVEQIGIRLHTDLLDVIEAHRERERGSPGGMLRKEPALGRLATFTVTQVLGSEQVSLLSGVGATLYEDGLVTLEPAHVLRFAGVSQDACPPGMVWSLGVGTEIIWSGDDTARLGSAQMEHACAAAINGLMEYLRHAVERFTNLLEATNK